MYRHFAVLTVAVTVCLAIFADGESRESLSEHLQDRKRKTELARVEAELGKAGKGGNSGLRFVDKRKQKQTWLHDPWVDSDFSSVGSQGEFTGERVAVQNAELGPTDSASVELLPASYEAACNPPSSLTDQECREQLEQQRKKRQARKPAKPSPDQVARLMEMSRRRSGD